MTPFDVTVVESLDLYKPDNTGPKITDFISAVSLLPGQSKTVSVGKVYDSEADTFYVKSWGLLDGVTMPSWLSFVNATISSGLLFEFSPPLSA